MNEVVNIRAQMKELNDDIRSIVHSLTVPQSFPQKSNIRMIDARLLSIFTQSSQFVKKVKHFKQDDRGMVDSIITQFKESKNQADKIEAEVIKREEEFTREINERKKTFQTDTSNMSSLYRSHRNDENERHISEMTQTQNEIDRLNSTFDEMLSTEVGKCVKDKDQFQSEYDVLYARFLEMKSSLESQLSQSDQQVERYSNELKEIEERNSKLLSTLETSYQKKLEEVEGEFKKSSDLLIEEGNSLKRQMNNFDVNQNGDLHLLVEQLDKLNGEHEAKANAILEAKKKDLEDTLKYMEEMNIKEEISLRQEMAKSKSENQLKREEMKQKLWSLKEQNSAQENMNAEKLKITKLKAEQQITDLDAKRKKLILDQKGTIDLTKKRYLNDLKKQQKKSEKNMAQSKQKLAQLQAEFDAQKKKLEAEVTALIRKRNRLQLDLQNLSSTGSIRSNGGYFDFIKEQIHDIAPGSDYFGGEKITTVDGMVKKFTYCDKKSKKKLVEIREVKMQCESDMRLEKQRLLSQLEKTKTKYNNVVDEVRLLKIRKDELVNKQKMQNAIKSTELNKAETDLRSKIYNQREMLRQLNEELQKIRVDDVNKKKLSMIQVLQKREIKELQKQVDDFDESVVSKIEEKSKEMLEHLKIEKGKSGEVIKKMMDRLDEALQELSSVKTTYENEAMKEQQRWMDLRKDIADTNMKIYAKTQNQSQQHTRPSSSAIKFNRLTPTGSPLPSLRKH